MIDGLEWDPHTYLGEDTPDAALWGDPSMVDHSEIQSILAPYPELWEQWQARLAPEALASSSETERLFDIHQLHQPTYVRDVVRHHRHPLAGGDAPLPPAAAERLITLEARFPKRASSRRWFLADPWRRANTALDLVEREHDVDFLARTRDPKLAHIIDMHSQPKLAG